MINLLPSDAKRDIRAARTNVLLLRYNLLTLAGVAGLLIICLGAFFILQANRSDAESKTSANSVKADSYKETRKAADEYKQNLATAKTILNSSVNYTSTIFAITKLLPDGVTMDSLNLTASDFGKQLVLSFHARSYNKTTKKFDVIPVSYDKVSELKENFQNSKVFSNVFFQSVTTDDPTKPYPIAVSLSAQLNKVVTQ